MSRRTARLNALLRREISGLIARRLRDPRIGPVTVVDVEAAPDLGSAKVFVRPLVAASGSAVDELTRLLNGSAPELRRALGESMKLRRVPELRFRIDRSLEHSQRIESLIDELNLAREDGGREDDAPDPGEK